MAGPEVSLKGSPTVSPTTEALWLSDPLPPKFPASMYFLALSHAPPLLAIKRARNAPITVAPKSMPPRVSLPRRKPTATGVRTATRPGATIFLRAATVAMDTQVAGSGLTPSLPSSSPGISLNWRRISSTILNAASPTDVIVKAAQIIGTIPPIKTPMTTKGFLMSIIAKPAAWV